jgi:hypothetical protein
MSFQITNNLGKDPNIKGLSKENIPPAPEGFRPLQMSEKTPFVSQAAKFILEHSQLGDQIEFTIAGHRYLGRSEPHYHEPPPPGTEDTSRYPKPWGWHRGVTVFAAVDDRTSPTENYQPDRPTSGRLQVLQRINDLITDLDSELR